ncbi:mercury(II) reductase [Aquifex pyrophilus]
MIRLKITGMTCHHCALTVKKALESVEGVKRAEVYFPQGYAEVEGEADVKKLIEAVEKAGYGAEEITSPEAFIPSKNSYDLLIIGGGSAGFAAAIRAIDLGAEKVLIAEDNIIGGTCLNRGCIPSKYFIDVANLFYRAKNPEMPGVKIKGAEINLEEVVSAKDKLLEELRMEKYWNVLEAYPQIEYIQGSASFAAEDRAYVGSREVSFYRAVIAAGSRPFIPPVRGIEETDYFTSDDIFDIKELPERLIILGGGAVGLELGQAFLRMGSEVVIVEAREDILLNAEPELRNYLKEYLLKEGIELLTGTKAVSVKRKANRIKLVVKKEGKELELEGTHLLVATGRVPNTDKIKAEKADVELDEKGFVKVNEYLQTSNERVYAAGDCVDTPFLVTVAALEGSVAAENALKGNNLKIDYNSIPRAIFTDPELASVGLTEGEAKKEGFEVDVRVLELSKVPRAKISFRTNGAVKMVVEKGSGRVLGVHVLAPHGAEIIHRAVPVVKYGLTINDVINMVDVYPTLSECIKLCAQSFKKDISKLSCCAQ